MTEPRQTAVLDVANLTISYTRRGEKLRVLDDVSFQIAAGEAFGVVGESGCGKTTAAMAVMRHLPENATIDAGVINFDGRNLLELSDRELDGLRGDRIAMVYQDPATALNPSMRVGQQVAEVYRYHRGLGKRDALTEATKMLDRVKLPNATRIARRYPHQLSGGQQQRVMIAMALATDPRLLVLDEPTTGLDATVEAEVLDLVATLRNDFDAAILFISHNLGIVANLCDRVGVLYAGQLLEQGAAGQTLREPRHPYTLGLLRSIPSNDVRKDRERLVPIAGSLPPLGTMASGCIYADRCPIVRDTCLERPIPLVVSRGRLTRCLYPEEVPTIPKPIAAGTESSPDESILLKIENLSKTYSTGGHRVRAVDDVSLELRKGEVFGLVGESGSGKTTLARCIAGITSASDGAMFLEGREIPLDPRRRSPELRRQIQIVFQNPDGALNPTLSVRRILGRAIKLLAGRRSAPQRQERLHELVRAVRLNDRYLDVRPVQLSGGLKQRVAIARALAGQPALVVCDEPTSALDVSVQAAILNLLVDLQRDQRISYIFISHDLATVRYIADRVGVMYLGQLVECGSADDVYAPPYHPYTESLLSANRGTGCEDAGRIMLTGAVPDPAHPPSGCRFHTRCPRYLGEICKTDEPPWQSPSSTHAYKCHIAPADLEALQRREHAATSEERDAVTVT